MNDLNISDGAAAAILFVIILMVSYIACAFIGASFDVFEWPLLMRALLLGLIAGNGWFCFGDFEE